uniref:ABC-2 type transporter n=1 Tax=Dixoniella grisea TaxID=35153 RepID=UPI001FCCC3C3|nr:ABC-2 type transporter [Dixoniella grisea]UNJ17117.1 ABC-2 type transporter [Dixoniella grisea]
MRNQNKVLYPQWDFKESLGYIRYIHLLQENTYLIIRLILQSYRRSSTLIVGIIQPLLWQSLFGAVILFQEANLISHVSSYGIFLSSGIIVFTAFTGALNSGLSIMFDREFGFFNRLLIIPLISRFSISIASIIFMTLFSFLQTALIVGKNIVYESIPFDYYRLILINGVLLLMILGVTIFSFWLTFFLPGHIELLAFIFLVNSPILFASTALAPLDKMPSWLKVIASLNPITYTIESIRYLSMTENLSYKASIITSLLGQFNLTQM